MQIVPPAKDNPGAPSFVKPLEHGRRGETTNLNLLDHPIPCHFGINDELLPNPVLDLSLMSLYAVEHFVITFNSNGPKRDAPREVPNFDFFFFHTSSEPVPQR